MGVAFTVSLPELGTWAPERIAALFDGLAKLLAACGTETPVPAWVPPATAAVEVVRPAVLRTEALLVKQAQQVFIDRGVSVLAPADLRRALEISPSTCSRVIARLVDEIGLQRLGHGPARRIALPGIEVPAPDPRGRWPPSDLPSEPRPAPPGGIHASGAQIVEFRDKVLRGVLKEARKPLGLDILVEWMPEEKWESPAAKRYACQAALTRLRIHGKVHQVGDTWLFGPAAEA